MSPRVRRAALAAAAVLASALAAATLAAAWTVHALDRPYAGWSGPSTTVLLERGLSAGAMIDRLHEHGVVEHPRLARLWLRWTGDAGTLHAGEYRFDAPATAREVLGRLRAGDVVLHALTVPEGLSAVEVAARIRDAGFGTLETALAAVGDGSPAAALDPAATDLEGYLFPDTYRFPRGTQPGRVVTVMVARFAEVAGEDFERRAREAGLTLREAVTLASLIEKETSLPEERGRISRVFHNRLERGMKLQCDPTVLYALRRDGIEVDRLLRAHLDHDSPWNTYRVKGLPPGPICSPGAESLEAALAPEPGSDLYFVAKPGGGHAFSRTLDAHLRAVREWRRYARSSR